MTEELKIIAEIFNNVTDGAIYGGLAFLGYKLVVDTLPWLVGYFITKYIVDVISKLRVKKKTNKE